MAVEVVALGAVDIITAVTIIDNRTQTTRTHRRGELIGGPIRTSRLPATNQKVISHTRTYATLFFTVIVTVSPFFAISSKTNKKQP